MALPADDVARVLKWCIARVPEDVRDRVRVECEVADRHLTIVERHPPLPAIGVTGWTRSPVARLRYAGHRWSLLWRDRDERFHRYTWHEPTTDVALLLAEIDRDPTALFRG